MSVSWQCLPPGPRLPPLFGLGDLQTGVEGGPESHTYLQTGVEGAPLPHSVPTRVEGGAGGQARSHVCKVRTTNKTFLGSLDHLKLVQLDELVLFPDNL